MILRLLASAALLSSFAAATHAQPFTTVQLPTFQRFSTTTSVLVPDQGRIHLGGMNSGYRSSSRRGSPFLPSSRSSSGGATASGASVSAYIHHFEELDAAVLAEARRQRGGAPRPEANKAQALPPQDRNTMSRIGEMRARTQAKARAKLAVARQDYELAQKLIAKGKLSAARSALRNSYKRADERLKQTIKKQYAELDRIQSNTQVAARR